MIGPILASVLIQYQAVAAPVLVPPPASTDGGGSRRLGSVPTVQYQSVAAPVLVPNVLLAPSTVIPVYPSRVFPKRPLRASLQRAYVTDTLTTPAPVTAPDLVPQQDTALIRRVYRRAAYEPAHPEFGVEVRVPVMSWTGWYDWRHPHWAKRRHASQMPALFWDTVLFPDVVVAPDEAVPVYPDRIYRTPKLRAYPQPSWPPFTADATVVVPSMSWQPEYPDRIWPKRGLHARHHRDFAFYPQEIPVIAVSPVTGGRGYFVVSPRARDLIVQKRVRTFRVH